MELVIKKPREFINPLLSKKSVDEAAFNAFKQSLAQYKSEVQAQINAKQTEPNTVSNALKPFIESFGYKAQSYSQKGQSGIDLAILQDDFPNVIIEAKVPHSHEMLTESNPNRKALQETVLYFLREREKGNHSLKHIIITDFYNWFIFDAKEFEHIFFKNKKIQNLYKTHTDKNQLIGNTSDFYRLLGEHIDELQADLIGSELLHGTSFDLHPETNHTDKELIGIYKLLSPDSLLKQFNPNDANALNKDFYHELLYILGLEERKDGGKKVIDRTKEPQQGTLYENSYQKLSQYKKPHDFESIIRLIIVWINRILFLKLLEAQIVQWTDQKEYKFLTYTEISQYDHLEDLFFEILAKQIHDRTNTDYNHIPYLNSALFEIHPDEQRLLTIANLSNDAKINYYGKTVIKDSHTKRKTGQVNTLKYLFDFLDAYNFGNDSAEEIVSETKTLINASVLGLIFEKINGYKDGSFYTPSFITMYMARETITKAVIGKFNTIHSWECKTLNELHNKIEDKAEANRIVNTITICDPAVGSGHFLVSSLNELIFIKNELGILIDENGKKLKCTITIENDELVIIDDNNEVFHYKPKSKDSTRIQKTLFNEKQTLIENCLFGVDINPNSTQITKLRLWIELLKNAYYKDNGTLETLPNIDINIKTGNSLISRFAVGDTLQNNQIKEEIAAYKTAVNNYKTNKGNKHEVMNSIEAIKAKFSTTMKISHRTTKELNLKLKEWVSIFGYKELDDNLILRAFKAIQHDDLFGVDENITSQFKGKQKKMLDELKFYQHELIEFETGKIYENAFEWRYEFPEVLDEDGNYIGFDVVIGNPPYGVKFTISEKTHFQNKFTTLDDIYSMFIELIKKIAKKNAHSGFITPISWLTGSGYKSTRSVLSDDFSLYKAINLPYNVFVDAYVDTGVYFFKRSKVANVHTFELKPKFKISSASDLLDVNFNEREVQYLFDDFGNITLGSSGNGLSSKIFNHKIKLGDITSTARGILANKEEYHLASNGADKKVFVGVLNRYSIDNHFEYIKYGDNLREKPSSYNLFTKNRILVRRIINRQFRIMATLVSDEFVCKKDIYIVKPQDSKYSCEFLLAIINSKLISYFKTNSSGAAKKDDFTQLTLTDLRTISIPNTEKSTQKPFIEKVNAILTAKQSDPAADTSALEAEIDVMVYCLYGLRYDEVKTIDPDFSISESDYNKKIGETSPPTPSP